MVLHTFEELSSTGDQVVRLLEKAKEKQDWDLCKELARFLMALDESGGTLRRTLELVDLKSPVADDAPTAFTFDTMRLSIPQPGRKRTNGGNTGMSIDFQGGSEGESSPSRSPASPTTPVGGYFSNISKTRDGSGSGR